MKKSSKVMLLTAAVVGVVGIGMSIGGVAMGATIAGLNLSKYGFDGIVKQTAKYISLDDKDDWEQDWDEITQLEPVETDNDKEIFETAPISDLKLSLSGDELKFRSYDGRIIFGVQYCKSGAISSTIRFPGRKRIYEPRC